MSIKKGQNQYLDYLVDPSFQGLNRLSVLSFEDNATSTRHARFLLSAVEEKIIMLRLIEKPFRLASKNWFKKI